ncbi:hypothetical protein [Amycolatopsis sp. DSM 110486]|uniref:hypothetical protein n=1 Tax=Amycolatopsis sp. DSM 110486 TaxID=2865832 RepID=UPI001C69B8FD|nr:hypothetical protein [Amycolatopsis sp. DSM 110486]QYN17597.1 hypothetical protein K1T34_32960 [Amycolatopsis sp. DSM 110486]
MARQKPPENAWANGELDRAARVASEINADAETQGRVTEMWRDAANKALISTAAAYRIGDPPTGRLIRPNNAEGWESECWQYYDTVGELHYVAGQNGRAVALARMFIAQYDDEGIPREVETGNAAALSRDLLGGETMSSELKFALGVQGMIAGQSLITVSDTDGWAVYSDQDFKIDNAELRRAASGGGKKGVSPYLVDRGGARKERLQNGTLVIHMWDRHPGRAWQVDSSTRPAMPYLRELCRLDEYVQSTLLSRIASAGILQVPQGASTAAPPGMDVPEGMDPLMHVLATVGQANITDPGTAAAVLPVLLTMPPGEALQHLTLDYPLTGVINEFRNLNLKRVAMSMDLAPEVMTGFSGVKYSNAEFIQDESTRTHIVRRVAAIASALTRAYVVPALGEEFLVRWDLAELEAKPDRSENAIQLYDRGEIDGDTLREATGLRDGQAPEGDELLRQIAYRAVTVNPALLPAMAELLGVTVPDSVTQITEQLTHPAGQADDATDSREQPAGTHPADTGGAEAAAQRTDKRHADAPPVPDLQPRTPTDNNAKTLAPRKPQPLVSDALVAACDVVVSGALGRAGAAWRKRKRSRVNATRSLETQAIYLEHPICGDRKQHETPQEHAIAAFGGRFSAVQRIAALHDCNPECLQATLVNYTAELIVERKPHCTNRLTETLGECVHA